MWLKCYKSPDSRVQKSPPCLGSIPSAQQQGQAPLASLSMVLWTPRGQPGSVAPCWRALRPWGPRSREGLLACSLGKGSFLGGLPLKHHSGPWPQWPEHPTLGEVAIGLSGGFLKLPAVTTPVRLSKSHGELSSLLQVPGVVWELLEPLLCLGMVLLWWYCSYHRMINGGKGLWRSAGPTPSQSRASFGLVW